MGLYTRISPIGVNLDVDPIEAGDEVWNESLNMIPVPGAMVRAKGYTEIFATPLFDPLYLQYTPQLGDPHWAYCGADNIGVIDETGAHLDITPASLTSTVQENGWSGGNLNGLCVLNAVENEPYYWFNGQPLALALPGQRASTRYRVMRPFKYHLVGMGYTDAAGDFRDGLHWSNAADPGQIPDSWVPTAENEAGDNILADENGDIIDGLALRDSFYIYKSDSVYEMSYVGGAAVMRFRKVFGTVGLLAANCVARVKGTHVVLGNGDIYQHDGQNQKSIIDGKLRKTYFKTIDDTNFRSSYVVYNEAQEEVWFCTPLEGEERPRLALVWSVTTNEFGYRTLPPADFAAVGVAYEPLAPDEVWDDDPLSWQSDTSLWLEAVLQATQDTILLADAEARKLYVGNTGTTANGADYNARVSKYGVALGNPQKDKMINRIWPRINAPTETVFKMTLYNQRDPMAALEKVYEKEFTQGVYGVPVTAVVRYCGVQIESEASVDWDIAGLDFDFMERGMF